MLRCAVPELNSPHGVDSFFSSFLVSSYDVCISERSNRLSSLDSGDRSCVCRLRLQHFRIPAGRAAARHGGKPQQICLLHGTRYYRLCWVVSIMSLPLALLTARFERKKLLLFLLGLFAICHFAVLWVDSFWSLYATRIGVALAHSIFWSIMNPLAARMRRRANEPPAWLLLWAAPSLQRFWASRSEQNGAPLRMGGILLCHRRSGLFSAYAPLVCPAAVSEQECRLA